MERLTIKELAPYLPYDLEVLIQGTHTSSIRNLTNLGFDYNFLWNLKQGWVKILDLRPLSSLTEEIEHNGEKFVPIDKINHYGKTNDLYPKSYGICDRSIGNDLTTYGGGSWEGGIEEDISTFQFYRLYEKLFEWHFDVFGLIDRSLALPIDGKEVEGE